MTGTGIADSDDDDKFLSALKALGRGWIEYASYDTAFLQAIPAAYDDHDFGAARLAEALERLRAKGAVSFQIRPENMIQRGGSRLPARLKTLTGRKERHRKHLGIEWDSRLAPMVRGSSDERKETLAMIDRWLKDNAHKQTIRVPVNTRSLHIFGEEKTLMILLRGTNRISPTLSLDDLRCYVPHEAYLPHVRYSNARSADILIVENKQTYHSMKLRNERVQTYAAVGFGSGSSVSRSVPAMADLAEQTGGAIFYFGDIDIPGFEIAMKLSSEAMNLDTRLCINPANDLYRELLDIGIPSKARYDSRYAADKIWTEGVGDFTRGWLPSCSEEIDRLIVQGQRLAQEWVH